MKLGLKKLVVGVMSLVVLAGGTLGLVSAQAGNGIPSGFGDLSSTTNVGVAGAGTDQGGNFIPTVKKVINWILGMLSLIALIVLLYGGFQMVTAAGDDGKYKKGFKVLKHAAGGLIFIGVSYLFISFIFWIIGAMVGKPQTGA